MTKKSLLTLSAAALMVLGAASCSKPKSETAIAIEKAEKMTYAELKEAAKTEMEASTETFKVLGLTSVLVKAVNALAKECTFLETVTVGKDESGSDLKENSSKNVYVNNGYKDYTLLTALEPAKSTYVADFALTQDERSISDYVKSGILHNFVPSDYKSVGLDEKDTMPLKGIHFNKVFWTNTNFQTVTGKTLYNIWQVAGTSADTDHLAKVSFQSPVTEQINMSFLLSCYAPSAQARIEKAYKDYYGKDWVKSGSYTSAGQQWVEEFIKNVSRWHDSDGTAMKETQLKDDWNEGYVYFGAYSKMKDAAGKNYAVAGQDTDPILKDLVKDGKVNAMKTVKWDWEINGFNGYFYTMDAQIANNAKHPYTACLFARYLLEPSFYASAIYSDKTPNSDGTKGNQYGYYYPGTMPAYGTKDAIATTNSYDWTKTKWKEVSLVEDYDYLKTVKATLVAKIQGLVGSATSK